MAIAFSWHSNAYSDNNAVSLLITANRIECIKYLKIVATNTAQLQVLVIFYGIKFPKKKNKKKSSWKKMEENITSIFIQIPLYLVLFNTLILIYILLCRAFQ